MGIFLLALTIILFLISINKTNKKIYDKNLKKYKTILKQSRKKIIILGVLSIILILAFTIVLNINKQTESEQTLNTTLPIIYILLLAYIIAMFSFIVQWILVPSKEKIKRDAKKEKINEELKKFNFDKKIKYNSNIVCFDNSNRILAIINTYKNTCDLIKYEEITNCEILENDQNIMNDQNGTIIGIGARKSRETIDLKLKINTINPNKNSYIICIRDTEIENEALDFINKVYRNIIAIIK